MTTQPDLGAASAAGAGVLSVRLYGRFPPRSLGAASFILIAIGLVAVAIAVGKDWSTIPPPRVLARIAGMAAWCLRIGSPAFPGPLSSRTGGSDMSCFVGLPAGGIVYHLLARRPVQTETPALDLAAAPSS